MGAYTVRPLSDRTAFTGAQYGDPFRSSWVETEHLLLDEIDRLGGHSIVLELDVREQDIRLDGTLRANARPSSPAVRVAFESNVGPLTYATDRYATWLANARAIALGLQALRAVDRYGITRRGEQYTGFKALPAGRAMPASHMTRTAAAELLERIAIGEEPESRDRVVQRILDDPEHAREVWREARRAAHPDRRNGERVLWDQVEEAATVLRIER